MKSFWLKMSERERRMVKLCSYFLITFLLYIVVFVPIHRTINTKRILLQETIANRHWLIWARKQLPAEATVRAISVGQVLTVISKQLKDDKSLRDSYNLKQVASNQVQIEFTEAPFNQCMIWLQKLTSSYNIIVSKIQAKKGKEAGVASLTVVLEVPDISGR